MMKTSNVVGPVAAAVQQLIDTGTDAVHGAISPVHQNELLKRALTWAGASLVALVAAKIAHNAFMSMMVTSEDHHQWKASDTRLDTELENSMDASDPVAKY